ncbi:hypothetical protein CA54_06320 [Symmachiella macrocystis]|uniref:Cryptic autophosphorylating protein tyrosine kinase Etk n=1 Tax=Symmachiella macrocystis TaxID=2527985 RepID=A0A5C6BJV6_9PLAN|nr:hypothetical protein [Symmachiella macrocystis]TWU11821.1 hypothetical protein CA54_06320 [Symmachiella macrocystis]
MTNRDLSTNVRQSQIATNAHNPQVNYPAYTAAAQTPQPEDQPSLFLTILQKRWWLLGIICLLAGGLSYFIATEFRSLNADVSGSLIYSGLPTPPGPVVYQAPSLQTYKEVLFSTSRMQKIVDKHGLDIPPDIFASLFEMKVIGRSSVMELTLGWPEEEVGVELVNDTMQTLIDAAAEQRQAILTEHMKHVEIIHLGAKREVDEAAEELSLARLRHDTLLHNNGLATQEYSNKLKSVSNTNSTIDLKNVELLSIKQQLAQAEKIRQEKISVYQTELLKKRQTQLDLVMEEYAKTSTRFAELTSLKIELAEIDTTGKDSSLVEWETALDEIGLTTLGPISQIAGPELTLLKTEIASADKRISDFQFRLDTVKNHLHMLNERLAEYDTEATDKAGDVAIASSEVVAKLEKKLESAEGRSKLISLQLENMDQLYKCKSREFAVLIPASVETAIVTSNTKKLFVMSFFACSILLVCPVVLTEWLLQRETAVSAFSRRWSLPLMTDRALAGFNSRTRSTPDWKTNESIRMAALRIQQSLPESSSVVLFSGLGDTPAPAGVLNSLSECLAHRGERILLVDAVDRQHGKFDKSDSVSDLSHPGPAELPAAKTATEKTAAAETKQANDGSLATIDNEHKMGLSDIFSNNAPITADLIQHTENPCVDLIGSGEGVFPVEAMASARLTELLKSCQSSYSMIFIAGPPIASRADLQMLAARADAIVLTADKRSVKDPASPAAIRDLIELQAPVIGVMA